MIKNRMKMHADQMEKIIRIFEEIQKGSTKKGKYKERKLLDYSAIDSDEYY